ncbi:uncharacterized protein [Cicer arietinum]|uniref:uncharacterized protein n=1 Tax=Cicer arietinum TaxID=3827 RepID=UPI003CC586E3
MIGNVSSNFSDLVIIGERVEIGLKSRKIASGYTRLNNTKKLPVGANKKKEEESHLVTSNPTNPSFVHYPYATATSQNSELLPHLVRNSMVALCPGKPIEPPYPKGYDSNALCDYHSGAIGHSTENFLALKFKVHDFLKVGWLNFKENEPSVKNDPLPVHGRWERDDGMIATQSEEILGITIPKPLVIHFTKEESMNAPGIGGMTRSGQIDSLGKSQKEIIVASEKAYTDKGKKKVIEEVQKEKVENEKGVSNEEAREFLKIIQHSEYEIVDQLNHIPTRISLFYLLLNYESHRKLLMKILNEPHVTHDITLDKFGGIINNITANNHLIFTNDELSIKGRGDNKALHILVMCFDHIISKVLIDNGSSLNVISKLKLAKLPCDGTYMRPIPVVVRAFEGSRRELMGEIELPVQIGPVTFEITFHVMDTVLAYSCLLRRPWIHSSGVVPLTLHQKLKYMVNDQLVIMSGEGDLLVSKLSTTPYVETAEEALETVFQTLEIMDTAYVETTPIEPHMSNIAIMVAKFMLSRGHHPWRGQREKRLARIENREPRIEKIPICDIRQNFQSARPTSEINIAAAEDDIFDGEANWIHPCGVGAEIRNWKIVKSPIIFNTIPIFGNSSFRDDCSKISPHNFDHLISQREKDNEEDYESPLDLLRSIEQEAKGIMPFEEPI